MCGSLIRKIILSKLWLVKNGVYRAELGLSGSAKYRVFFSNLGKAINILNQEKAAFFIIILKRDILGGGKTCKVF